MQMKWRQVSGEYWKQKTGKKCHWDMKRGEGGVLIEDYIIWFFFNEKEDALTMYLPVATTFHLFVILILHADHLEI